MQSASSTPQCYLQRLLFHFDNKVASDYHGGEALKMCFPLLWIDSQLVPNTDYVMLMIVL